MEILGVDIALFYLVWIMGGGAIFYLGTALLAGGLTWAVRRWRKEDAFGVEAVTLGVLDPDIFEAQPQIGDPARKPKSAIPPRPVR